MIVSGTQDTGEILKTEINLTHGLKTTADELAAYHAFRRVWQSPTDQEPAPCCNGRNALPKLPAAHIAGFNGAGQAEIFQKSRLSDLRNQATRTTNPALDAADGAVLRRARDRNDGAAVPATRRGG